MAYQQFFVKVANVFNVLWRIVHDLGYLFISCTLTEPQTEQVTIPWITHVFIYGVAHIAVSVIYHNLPPKENAVTLPYYGLSGGSMFLAALFNYPKKSIAFR